MMSEADICLPPCQPPSTLKSQDRPRPHLTIVITMPVPVPNSSPPPLFPELTRAKVNAALTSSWLETFEDLTAPTTIISIDDLGERDAFLKWLRSDSIFLPEGAGPASDDDAPTFHLPKLNEAITAAIKKYGAVFPKLNWTAPRVCVSRAR